MSFTPSFGTLSLINSAIQQGRGAAASVLGQTYDVRRLTSTTTGAVSNNAPVLSAFPARLRRVTSRVKLENQIYDLLAYEATCNALPLKLQDVCTETGFENDSGVFTVAQMRPTRETIWIRTESAISITRPMPTAGRASQQPVSGAVAVSGYAGVSKANEQVLTLVNGLYGFVDAASNPTPASVYCGLQPVNRIKDAKEPKLPTALYREHFICYIPELPGVVLNELDRLNFPTSDRYEIAQYFSTSLTGVAGQIIVCEKLSN